LTENAVVWEVWSDNMIGESEALYAIEKDYDPYCYVCKRGEWAGGKKMSEKEKAIRELLLILML